MQVPLAARCKPAGDQNRAAKRAIIMFLNIKGNIF